MNFSNCDAAEEKSLGKLSAQQHEDIDVEHFAQTKLSHSLSFPSLHAGICGSPNCSSPSFL